MASPIPYYRKNSPSTKNEESFRADGQLIDLAAAHLDENSGTRTQDAQRHFDDRAAAAIRASSAINGSGDNGPPRVWPVVVWVDDPDPDIQLQLHPQNSDGPWFDSKDLLEMKWYKADAPTIFLLRAKALAMLAYGDYFPQSSRLNKGFRRMVSRAILGASPGWCGTFGPGVDGLFSLTESEGNYDLSEMHLVAIAYRYYDDLTPAAREYLIEQLLQRGRIHRPREDDTFTSGTNPNDWRRAGFISPLGDKIDIGETENHILMIVTARYLTNQLLFQRLGGIEHDNRRNQSDDSPSCFSLLLTLLQHILRDDFSEYNAKNYQAETRWALVNLCSYAYDHEIRLGARLALDYLSARIAVSSNDLRRLVPFRRRWTDQNMAFTSDGFMTVGLLSENAGDPMSPYFAMQAGNIRIYENPPTPGITDVDYATDVMVDILSDYRIPAVILDLFVNDWHRRFFQRLHRTMKDEVGGGRNADNMEVYAASPSYLITAGGAPATWALDPDLSAVVNPDSQIQQLGAAVTTSFIPTSLNLTNALDIIQFGTASKLWEVKSGLTHFYVPEPVLNYGVAPNFACGHQISIPSWINTLNTEGVRDGAGQDAHVIGGFSFVDMSRRGNASGNSCFRPGFYLAIYQETYGGLSVMEACDTWLHWDLAFHDFKHAVLANNANLHLENNVPARYVSFDGNVIDFVVWKDQDQSQGAVSGATINSIQYADLQSPEAQGHAENVTNDLVHGTIMNTVAEAKIEIRNPVLGATLTLDFFDGLHPSRSDSLTGETEVSGFNNEVWLDFEYSGESEGDVCRPFSSVEAAATAVADGGLIRIVPGASTFRGIIGGGKSFRIFAPIGSVSIGTPSAGISIQVDVLDPLSNQEVWLQFDWIPVPFLVTPFLCNRLFDAIAMVADGGTIYVEPGQTTERLSIGVGKRFTIDAPIGGVMIGLVTDN